MVINIGLIIWICIWPRVRIIYRGGTVACQLLVAPSVRVCLPACLLPIMPDSSCSFLSSFRPRPHKKPPPQPRALAFERLSVPNVIWSQPPGQGGTRT